MLAVRSLTLCLALQPGSSGCDDTHSMHSACFKGGRAFNAAVVGCSALPAHSGRTLQGVLSLAAWCRASACFQQYCDCWTKMTAWL
ncbi:hypothetical protein COO60DRAFT_1539365, partial [Scenedesmus sp. NREL 46B-D3]